VTSLRRLVEPGSKGPRVLRVLNLEDSPSDTELMQANLAADGVDCEMVRVQTRADFVAALEEGGFDLILADYAASSFDSLSALELAREVRPEVPFILVSGTPGEEAAIEAIKSGATDYVLKHRLGRLVPAVRRAIREAEEQREPKSAEEALSRSGILYRSAVEQATENICFVDVETKRIVEANATLSRSLGYDPEELRRMRFYDIVAHDWESIDGVVERVVEGEPHHLGEQHYRRKDGSLIHVEASVNVVPYGDKEAMCIVAHDVTERRRAEENLRHSLSVLLALREAGQVLGSTLSSEEIISRLLEIMRGVSHLTAALISMQDKGGQLRIWRSAGLEGLRSQARFEQEAEVARLKTLEYEEPHLFRLHGSGSEEDHLVGLCLPLRVKERVIGVLEAYGKESLADNDNVEILSSLASQAASALENARLYEELGERERRLQDLVGKLLRAQEEERRRVAYEVHDGLAQVAVAAHQRLQAFAGRHTPGTERGRRDLERILRLVRATVSDARRIIANLRPTTLDDLGLAATFSLEVERLREEGYQVNYEEDLGDERLPGAVEIALFRIMQEALTNVRKHAQTRRVSIRLGRSGNEAHLEVRDYGRGFDPVVTSAESGPGERVGLAGMRERVGMLGGELKIRSRPARGASIAATVPLTRSP